MDSREIKFRAWDTTEKTMHEVAWVRYQDGTALTNVGAYWNDGQYNGSTRLEPPRVVLMQYTGLKDKNGREIYEGDICRIDHQDARYPVSNAAIKWDDEEAGWSVGIGLPTEVSWSHEVIGNVYENPELLKEEK